MTRGPALLSVATFYRFTPIDDPLQVREWLLPIGEALGLRGSILLAQEGINATICAPPAELDTFLALLQRSSPFAELTIKRSQVAAGDEVFLRFKIKVKDEIVTLGLPGLPLASTPARHADPAEWHALLDDPEVRVIDVRNRYEIEAGSFPTAEDPGTDSFREFPAYVETHLDPAAEQRVAIFCTGGIRCEKAAVFLQQQGFRDVIQLDGGILNYLASVPAADNRWQGECFVFDQRVTVDAKLSPGGHVQCHACRRPVNAEQQQSADYEFGVSCPGCIGERPPADRARFAERARQMALAEQRGVPHLGPDAMPEVFHSKQREG